MILRDHHRALEFDLLKLGLRLSDFYTDRLSIRLLTTVIIPQLGPESALGRSVDPDAEVLTSWKTTDYLLARLIDQHAASVPWHTKPSQVQRPEDFLRGRDRRQALEEQAARVRRQMGLES